MPGYAGNTRVSRQDQEVGVRGDLVGVGLAAALGRGKSSLWWVILFFIFNLVNHEEKKKNPYTLLDN